MSKLASEAVIKKVDELVQQCASFEIKMMQLGNIIENLAQEFAVFRAKLCDMDAESKAHFNKSSQEIHELKNTVNSLASGINDTNTAVVKAAEGF